MNLVPLVLYAGAFVAYAWHFARREADVGRIATTLLVAAALAHTFVIGMQTMAIGQVPIAGRTSAISTFDSIRFFWAIVSATCDLALLIASAMSRMT